MRELIPFPGKVGDVIVLSTKGVTSDPPSAEPFRVGDLCDFPLFPSYRFRVVAVEGQRVHFKRIS